MKYLLFIVLIGCVPPPEHHPLRPPFARHTITLHGDTGFSAEERLAIDATTSVWNTLTNGVVSISIIWDFDANSTQSFIEHRNDNLLLLGNSHTYLGDAADQMVGGKVLAWVDNTANQPMRMWLVEDRLGGAKLQRVALHEFFHLAGLKDRSEPGHLMSKTYNTVDCLSIDEAIEFCSKWNCSPQDVRYCY